MNFFLKRLLGFITLDLNPGSGSSYLTTLKHFIHAVSHEPITNNSARSLLAPGLLLIWYRRHMVYRRTLIDSSFISFFILNYLNYCFIGHFYYIYKFHFCIFFSANSYQLLKTVDFSWHFSIKKNRSDFSGRSLF